MPRKTFPLRLEGAELDALARLSKVLRRPMNKLVGEAVRAYLARRTLEVERDLAATLDALRAYREEDPEFERAIGAFAAAEATAEDPVEGEPVEDSGPVRAEIQRLLNA